MHRFWPNLAWSSCRGRASIIRSFWWLEGLQTITQTMAPLWLLKHTKEKWNYSLCIYYSPHCVKHLILLSKDPVGWSIFNNFCTNLASLSFSPVYGLARQSLVCTHSNANLFFHFIFIILLKLWNFLTVLESFLQKNVLFFSVCFIVPAVEWFWCHFNFTYLPVYLQTHRIFFLSWCEVTVKMKSGELNDILSWC